MLKTIKLNSSKLIFTQFYILDRKLLWGPLIFLGPCAVEPVRPHPKPDLAHLDVKKIGSVYRF